ncbi:MAG: hypothetical protein HRU06_03470 [Oceanospirillaceae bacterium]|nr:hypothetical protein [Oceanospirillaceae bacterium]
MFDSHGKFIVSLQGNILRVDASGPFNHEAVDCYQEDVIAALKSLSGPWGQLILMHANCLYTPEAEERMYHFSQLRKELGLKAIALVFVDQDAMFIVKDKISSFYKNIDITYHFFTQQLLAEQWLATQLQPTMRSEHLSEVNYHI